MWVLDWSNHEGETSDPLDVIRAKIRSVLRAEGGIQIGSLSAKVVLDGAVIKLTRWSPDWNPWRDSPLNPVWIEFPNLPLRLFNSSMINRICEPIGEFLGLDAATENRSRPNIAKAKVEIDLSKPLTDRIRIEIEGEKGVNKGFWQNVRYDYVPKFCSGCCRIGHSLVECRRRRRDGEVEKPQARKVEGGDRGMHMLVRKVYALSNAYACEGRLEKTEIPFHFTVGRWRTKSGTTQLRVITMWQN